MRRWFQSLLVSVLVFLIGTPAFAASAPPLLSPAKPVQAMKPVLVAFGAIANRYTDVNPATVFDLNGDLVGDLTVGAATVTMQNGAQIQLLDPAVLNLDQVQTVPASGYSTSAPVQLSRVYVVQFPGGGYAKFILIQASPKVTIWFHYGTSTTSQLTADGANGHAVLTWNALADAQLGYHVYRYEVQDNSYTVTLLNDFTVQGTTFTDDTAENRTYLYVVIAIKSNGSFGSSTTVAAVSVQSVQRNLQISLVNGTAKLDSAAVAMDAPPVIKNGRLMVPATLLTSAGVTVTFDAATKHVTLSRRLANVTYTVVMTVDAPEYTWNGSSYKADVPPYTAGSAVMVPLRVVAPALGFGLMFNSTNRTATLQWFE